MIKNIYAVTTTQENPINDTDGFLDVTMTQYDITDEEIHNDANMGCSPEYIMMAKSLGYDDILEFAIDRMGYITENEGTEDLDEINPDEATICDFLEEIFEEGDEEDEFPAIHDFIEIKF